LWEFVFLVKVKKINGVHYLGSGFISDFWKQIQHPIPFYTAGKSKLEWVSLLLTMERVLPLLEPRITSFPNHRGEN
jgi:hypothetical protein